jgi:hypothetical protein
MKAIEGVLTAMATPFDERGGVDVDAARRLAAHLLEHGSHGLVIAGTTGECPTLTDEETIELLRAVRAEIGDEVLLGPMTPVTRARRPRRPQRREPTPPWSSRPTTTSPTGLVFWPTSRLSPKRCRSNRWSFTTSLRV